VDGINDNSFSVSLYVQRKRVGAYEYFLTMGAATTRGGVQMYFWTDNTMIFDLMSDYTYTSSPFPSDTGVWLHWAFVYNKEGNAMTTFRDGVAQTLSTTQGNGGTSSGPSTATGPIHLGVYKWSTSSFPFNGNMDEFLLFEGRALTAPDVLAIAQAASTPNTMLSLTISLSFDTSTNLKKDYSTLAGALTTRPRQQAWSRCGASSVGRCQQCLWLATTGE
jgi:hypothetical protein